MTRIEFFYFFSAENIVIMLLTKTEAAPVRTASVFHVILIPGSDHLLRSDRFIKLFF